SCDPDFYLAEPTERPGVLSFLLGSSPPRRGVAVRHDLGGLDRGGVWGRPHPPASDGGRQGTPKDHQVRFSDPVGGRVAWIGRAPAETVPRSAPLVRDPASRPGVSPRVVMDFLGHSQIGLTMNTYGHVIPDLRRDAAQRMQHLL